MIQQWIADSMAEMTQARLLTLYAAWRMDQVGAPAARTEIAMIKYAPGATVLYNVIDRAIQIHGSLGFSCDLPLEHMYRSARAARIYDGPDEVHKVTVARQVLKNYKAHEVPSEHIPTPPGHGPGEVRRLPRRHDRQRLICWSAAPARFARPPADGRRCRRGRPRCAAGGRWAGAVRASPVPRAGWLGPRLRFASAPADGRRCRARPSSLRCGRSLGRRGPGESGAAGWGGWGPASASLRHPPTGAVAGRGRPRCAAGGRWAGASGRVRCRGLGWLGPRLRFASAPADGRRGRAGPARSVTGSLSGQRPRAPVGHGSVCPSRGSRAWRQRPMLRTRCGGCAAGTWRVVDHDASPAPAARPAVP